MYCAAMSWLMCIHVEFVCVCVCVCVRVCVKLRIQQLWLCVCIQADIHVDNSVDD